MAEIAELPADAPVIDATTPVTPPVAIDPEEHARTKAALKAANREAEAHRLKLVAYEQAEQQKKELEMSATEKADARALAAENRAIEAEQKYSDQLLRNAFISESQKAQYGADGKGKIADWEAALILVKADPANKDLDPAGVADALKALATRHPMVIGATLVNGVPPTPPADEGGVTVAEQERRRRENELRIRNMKP